MEKMVQRWRKAVAGCNKHDKSLLIDNDYLEPIIGPNIMSVENTCPMAVFTEYESANANQIKKNSIDSGSKKNILDKKVKKQVSADSNYFSDTEIHNYEALDNNDDLSDGELLVNLKEKKECGSKNNLYSENHLNHSIIKTESELKKENKIHTFLGSKYNILRNNFTSNKENLWGNDYYSFTNQNDNDCKTVSKSLTNNNGSNSDTESLNYIDMKSSDSKYSHVYSKLEFFRRENTYAKLNMKNEETCNEDNDENEEIDDAFAGKSLKSGEKRAGLFGTKYLKRKIMRFDYKTLSIKQNEKKSDQSDDNKLKLVCLTQIKSSFANQMDAVVWYLNLLCDKMSFYVKDNKEFKEIELKRRSNMINAHLLYAKNFFEVKHATSKQLKSQLGNFHPCTIALACLLDSDAIRISEAHTCVHDNYVYLFTTKIKFCSWKVKYYIILKKPKRSSMGRLSLIEDVINCYKVFQDKSLN